jgi:hypothetical protein
MIDRFLRARLFEEYGREKCTGWHNDGQSVESIVRRIQVMLAPASKSSNVMALLMCSSSTDGSDT